jgi:hypothetical protein
VASGELDKTKFEIFKERAVGFRFLMTLDNAKTGFSFRALPGSKVVSHGLFVDQAGVIRRSRSREDPARGEPFASVPRWVLPDSRNQTTITDPVGNAGKR